MQIKASVMPKLYSILHSICCVLNILSRSLRYIAAYWSSRATNWVSKFQFLIQTITDSRLVMRTQAVRTSQDVSQCREYNNPQSLSHKLKVFGQSVQFSRFLVK